MLSVEVGIQRRELGHMIFHLDFAAFVAADVAAAEAEAEEEEDPSFVFEISSAILNRNRFKLIHEIQQKNLERMKTKSQGILRLRDERFRDICGVPDDGAHVTADVTCPPCKARERERREASCSHN